MPSSIGTSDTQGLPEPADRRGLLREGRHVVPSGSPRTGRASHRGVEVQDPDCFCSWFRGGGELSRIDRLGFCNSHEPRHCATRSTEPQPRGALGPAAAALDELKARPTGARHVLSGLGRRCTCSKRTTQSGKLSGRRGCRLLITRQTECCTQPELLVCGGAPPESNPRPHPYHRCAVISRRHALPRTAVHA
jgi:hypothetical protein